MGFYPDRLVDVLPQIGFGMLGIFFVTAVIIVVTVLLNKVTEKK